MLLTWMLHGTESKSYKAVVIGSAPFGEPLHMKIFGLRPMTANPWWRSFKNMGLTIAEESTRPEFLTFYINILN